MDVRRRLSRWALTRPHVLMVAADAGTELRWHAEAELVRRRWLQVGTPADADLLVTAGELGDLSTAADVLWGQVPPPRHWAHVDADADINRALDAAALALRELPAWPPAAEPRPPAPAPDEHGDRLDSHDMGGGHEVHDMSGDVAGLPMAGGGPDRDGLELDVLTVHLGPVLPGWPPGLVVRAAMQGDVLADVHAHAVGPTATEPPDPVLHSLDTLERVLRVSGWTKAAHDAARLRAELWRTGRPTNELTRQGRALVARVRGSRTLRWSLRGLRGADDRLLRCCAVVKSGLAGEDIVAAVDPLSLNDIPPLLDGMDVGSARLVVAALPLALGTHHPAVHG